jgi:hypothetical protein
MIRTTVLMLGTRYLPGYFYHLPSGSNNQVPVVALKYPGKQTGLTQIGINHISGIKYDSVLPW